MSKSMKLWLVQIPICPVQINVAYEYEIRHTLVTSELNYAICLHPVGIVITELAATKHSTRNMHSWTNTKLT